MNKWTVKQRIIAGFSAVILIMIALTLVSMFYLNEIKQDIVRVTSDTWPGLYFSSQIQGHSRLMLTSVDEYFLITDEEARRQVDAEIAANRLKFDNLMKN